MHPVTLTYPELKRLVSVGVGVGVLTAAVAYPRVVYFNTGLVTAVFSTVGMSLTVVGLLLALIARMDWKHPRFARWLDRPMVHGLWWGELTGSYLGQPIRKPIAFVVRQTYLTLSIKSFTQAIPGESTIEMLFTDARNRETKLCYAFQMTRWDDAENKATIGYGQLVLQNSGEQLAGAYWTNSPTSGNLRLLLVTRDCEDIHSFESAESRWTKMRAKKHADSLPD